MTYLTDVCVFLGDAARAATLHQLLLPYVGRAVVIGNATACYGAVSRYLGMRALEARLSIREEQSPAQPPTTPAALASLSQREREVLGVLATGKSNQEIADALFISLNTVATHVRNILTKTGAANRTEAAAYALRHGLSRG